MINLLGQIVHTIGEYHNFYYNFLLDEMYIVIVSKAFSLKGINIMHIILRDKRKQTVQGYHLSSI